MLNVLCVCDKLILARDTNDENHAIQIIEMSASYIRIKERFIAINATGIWCLPIPLDLVVDFVHMITEFHLQSECFTAQFTAINFVCQNVLVRDAIVRTGDVLVNGVIIHDQAIQVCAIPSFQVANKLTLALELFQALETNISGQRMILFAHVTHEKFVAGKLFVATLAGHVLRLFQEIQVAQDERELGGGQQMTILGRIIVIDLFWDFRFWFDARAIDNWLVGV